MTLTNTTIKLQYTGDGSTLVFPYTFKIWSDSELVVKKEVIATGVQTTLLLTTEYTVSGAGDDSGGSITLTDVLNGTAPETTEYLLIERVVPLTQESDFVENDEFPAATHENALDKLTMISQQIQDKINRTLQLPSTTTAAVDLPTPSAGYLYASDATTLTWAALTSGDYPGDLAAGNDASKSATPAVNDIYFALDTGKIYYCATTNVWSEFIAPSPQASKINTYAIQQTNYDLGSNNNGNRYQSFTPLYDMYVSSISLYHKAASDPTRTVTVRIETDDGTPAPTGTLVTGMTEISVSGLVNGWVDYSFNAGEVVKLEGGTRYWIKPSLSGGVLENWWGRSGSDTMPDEYYRLVSTNYTGSAFAFKLGVITSAVVGAALKMDSSGWGLAQADSDTNAQVIGVVSAVSTSTVFTTYEITLDGYMEGLSGLTPGSMYYLSPSSPGVSTATKPTTAGQFVKPIFIAASTTSGYLINQYAEEIVAAPTPDWADAYVWEGSVVVYEDEIVEVV